MMRTQYLRENTGKPLWNRVVKPVLFGSLGLLGLASIVATGTSSSTTPAGGGSGSSVSGTASSGALLTGTLDVTLRDAAWATAADDVTCTATVATAGFTCDVTGKTPPFLIKAVGTDANGASHTIYSVATATGTANVNPLTNLAVANALGKAPETAFADPANNQVTAANLTTAVNSIRTNILANMTGTIDAGINEDPFTAAITAGQGFDKLFDYVTITVTSGGGFTMTDKLTNATILAGTAGVTDLATANTGNVSNVTNITSINDLTDAQKKAMAQALKVAEQVSVVDAGESTTGQAAAKITALKIGPLGKLTAASIADKNTPYFTDPQNVFVEERSANTFNVINEILCMMDNTGYDEMVNFDKNADGTVDWYKAQIDEKKCAQDRDSAAGAGEGSQNQSSGTSTPQYNMFKVKSERLSPTSPHTVEFYFKDKGDPQGQPPMMIHGLVTITEGASDANPFGVFQMDFDLYFLNRQTRALADANTPNGKGLLKTVKSAGDGTATLQFAENFGFSDQQMNMTMDRTELVTLSKSLTARTGGGTASLTETASFQGQQMNEGETYNFAYNKDNFLRKEAQDADATCLDRNQFNETIWRYGVYTDAGARFERNSGFPIEFTSQNVTSQGWVGYYGMWFPEGTKPVNGDTVAKKTFGQGGAVQSANYTVLKTSGKLIKHTKKTGKLSDIKGVPLNYQLCPNNDFSNPQACTQYRVKWNDSTDAFDVEAKLDTQTYFWGDIAQGDPTTVSLAALPWNQLNLWSQERGSQFRIELDSCAAPSGNPPTFDCTGSTGDSAVVIYEDDIVYPGDIANTALYCLDQCPTGDANDPMDFSQGWQQVAPANATYSAYNFDATAYTLKTNPGNATIDANSAGQQFAFGMHSGPLFTAIDKASLACDDDANATCSWKGWNLNTFYTWETGSQDWNTLTLLMNGNTPVEFDQPLTLRYRHTNGSNYYLDYNGFGELHGIPGRCVGWDTGEEVPCGMNTRWLPEFSIPDGSELCSGDLDANGACPNGVPAYITKGLDKAQQMKANANGCAALTLTAYDLPAVPTRAPIDSPVVAPISTDADGAPLADPPQVIDGVKQL